MSFSLRIFGAAVFSVLAFALGACSPDSSPDSDATAAPPTPAEEKTIPDKAPAKQTADSTPAPVTSSIGTEAAPAEEKPKKFFDLVREGDRIILSGRIRSELQARDIAAALQIEGLTLDNKLEVDPKTPGVDWGNRIDEILPQLATIPGLHFHVEEGVITVTGTVKSEQEKNQWQRDIAYWMESPLIKDLKNELKIDAGATE